jgi:hypothetical protein
MPTAKSTTNRVAGLVFSIAFAACSSSGGGSSPNPPDAPPRAVDMAVVRVDASGTPSDGPITHADGASSTGDGHAASCDPVSQNCGSGMKCTLSAGSAGAFIPTCVADGTVAEGGACTGTSTGDNCAHGSLCIGAVCTRFCTSGMDSQCTAQSGGLCDLVITGSTPTTTVCSYPPACDPLAQNCADTSTACYWDPVKKSGYCFSTGTKATGTTCMYANDCVKGDICLDTGGPTGSCSQICSLGADAGKPACTAGTCTTLGTDPIGYCK